VHAGAVIGRYLAEVSETDAEGSTAEIYGDIRRVLGLPIVNLVYRHLAVEPVVLGRVWRELRPNLTSRTAERAARRLVDQAAPPIVVRIPAGALAAVGLEAERARLVRATLDAYARANSLNLLGMHALLDGCPGNVEPQETLEPPPARSILPMAELATLPATTVELLDEMSAALVGGEQPRLVPSLLRHFADDPALLALFWTALRPAAGAELAAARGAVATEARALAAELPRPVRQLEEGTLCETARRFVVAMSALLVAGEALRVAIAEAP
jgi:hypothetical protein